MALRRGQLEERFGVWDIPDPDTITRTLSLDFETYCDIDLKKFGLDLYSIHPSCEVLMCAWRIDNGPIRHWDATRDPMPKSLRKALEDDDIQLWAFNAQFERVIMNRVLSIWPRLERWRCTQALAYMHSFTGTLDMVGRQIGVEEDKAKLATGLRLMKMFSMPHKVSANQPHKRFTSETHPVEWKMFIEYNIRDVEAECEIKRLLHKPRFPIPEREWEFYALDQIINDRGLPIDRIFVENALEMANRRKGQLLEKMRVKTGLQNPGSPQQLLPWLQERGYPFGDLQKDSVKKVLTAWQGIQTGELKKEKDELYPEDLTRQAVAVLKLRQQQARTSTSKYQALLTAMGEDGRMRYVFQFCGASRTGRFAGRRFQPQNLTMMRDIESEKVLVQMTDIIRQNDYDALTLYRKEPLDALAGLVRSSVRAPKGKKLVVCDLASIESVVIGWVARCERLLNVFRDGKDAYKDFATELYKVAYEEVTKLQRKMAKPATLGAGYRLGGGEIKDGKKTGLWGYAENMGVEMSRKESHKNVATFRRVYKEIPQCWYDLEEAITSVIKRGTTRRVGPVKFYMSKPYLVCELPSGRCIFYKSPRIRREKMEGVDRETGERYEYWKDSISYMGKQQNGSRWLRINSHGGKFIENIVQAIARDILREGMLALHKAGFWLIGHVHDEAISEENKGDEEHNDHVMRELMIRKRKWMKFSDNDNEYHMPLNAAGMETIIYRKD
jgi:DNA polymerase